MSPGIAVTTSLVRSCVNRALGALTRVQSIAANSDGKRNPPVGGLFTSLAPRNSHENGRNVYRTPFWSTTGERPKNSTQRPSFPLPP